MFELPKSYTVSELARRLGVNRSQVSRWVTGRIRPSAESLQKIQATVDRGYSFLRTATVHPCPACNTAGHAVVAGGVCKAWCAECGLEYESRMVDDELLD